MTGGRLIRFALARKPSMLAIQERPPSTGETVEHFLSRWLDYIAKTRRPATAHEYAGFVHRYINPVVGKVALAELAPEHVLAVLESARKNGLAGSTARVLRIVFGVALTRAEKWQVPGARNVVRLTEPPSVEPRQARFLNEEEACAFLEAARGSRFEALYLISLMCGLRAGEVRALRWQDIDLQNQRLRVAGTLQEAQGARYWLGPPKSKSSYRTVALPAAATAALRAHYSMQYQEKSRLAATRVSWQNNWDLVFTTAQGKPLAKTTLRLNFRRLVATANLPTALRFHDLRHSCASLLFSRGVSARTISDLLGHSDVSTTLDLYTHLIPPARRDAAVAFDQLVEARAINRSANNLMRGARNSPEEAIQTQSRNATFFGRAAHLFASQLVHKFPRTDNHDRHGPTVNH